MKNNSSDKLPAHLATHATQSVSGVATLSAATQALEKINQKLRKLVPDFQLAKTRTARKQKAANFMKKFSYL